MAEDTPEVDSVQEPAPDGQASDVTERVAGKKAQAETVKKRRLKFALAVVIGIPYLAFVAWCLFLISSLPSRTGQFDFLIAPGFLTALVGATALLIMGIFGVIRVLQKTDILPSKRLMGIIRVLLVVLPGLALGVLTALVIRGEPALYIEITSPTTVEELVAPVGVTFNVDETVEILERRGLRPISYGWDFEGDGVKNQDTAVPTATAVYPRAGTYTVVVRIQLSNGETRRLTRYLLIPEESFRAIPPKPIVDEPTTFSVSHLFDDAESELTEVEWDFNGDGTVDERTSEPDIAHTFVRAEEVTVRATVYFANQRQEEFEKTLSVVEPPPLPFPVQIETEPQFLVSPPPFQTVFSLQTEEPIRSVDWDFGDRTEGQGQRIGHTFDRLGTYVVRATVRSNAGDTAIVSKVVRVVEELKIPDLSFAGTPEVDLKDARLSGELPLTVELTPRANLPLVEYFWEVADEPSVLTSTGTTLKAAYRRPGTYRVTLIALDPEGRVKRVPLDVVVSPPSSLISIRLTPEGGPAPLTVNFDASETTIPGENISGFEWVFGDESEANPQPRQGGAVMRHIYEQPGTYTVTLHAKTTQGNTYEGSRTIVVRTPLIDACFTASRISGAAPLGVQFDMSCTAGNPVSAQWDFGDGAQSDERNPIHVFEEPGEYEVVLKIENDAGNVNTETLTITAE